LFELQQEEITTTISHISGEHDVFASHSLTSSVPSMSATLPPSNASETLAPISVPAAVDMDGFHMTDDTSNWAPLDVSSSMARMTTIVSTHHTASHSTTNASQDRYHEQRLSTDENDWNPWS
jgi:hypothetical protein